MNKTEAQKKLNRTTNWYNMIQTLDVIMQILETE